MGAEHSRLQPGRRTLRKRLSLPLHLLTTNRSGSWEMSQNTPGSGHSAPDHTMKVKSSVSWNCLIQEDQFNEFEHDVLLSTWPLIAADAFGNGCLVFENAFNIFPDLKNFLPFNQFNPQLIGENEPVRRHVLAFMDVFARAIESLNGDREELYENFLLLGARHAAIPGMKIEYFKVFKQSILMTWESLMYEEFTEDVRRAWAHLIDYVIDILCEGCLVFEEEEEKMLMNAELPHRASDGQIRQYQSNRRRSGRPSVVSMTPDELSQFYSICR
ncbi:hypothetical protein EG68_01441 [Paragonimus skrjabini miyazakii]|uniref:Globin domain-containing protein n=1 Tax=Paragonimus skrjabini miyazakii TaxID=59628 RepID=A0A8S9Z8L4_9TREM|nr:hypothetical protein EG68_01441 [Paragonimus skrjabini miyazakii]